MTDPNPGSQFNAFYSNNRVYYTLAIPTTKGYDKSLSSIVNVAAHEWGHAITSRNSNLIYPRESGALNEAFSDWLGIAIGGPLYRNR
ncbi:M4 family metallopeptidase [Abyssogena phaseoliformis symbiont]|uniref:M4 family metallopeptidase n=1 Tax=Abyssogena phaseoliformis symbiont TaxID=596095 RepID=UPI001914E1A1|nr:M4 family metallopeptidase [Abyssogena phaseoliformis symbiont]